MHKRKIKALLSCFMIICIFGMGFTGYKVKIENKNMVSAYIESGELEDSREKQIEENLSIIEEAPNLIEMLENRVDVKLVGYTLTVEDKKIGTLKKSSEIEEVLKELKKEYLNNEDGNTDVKEIKLLENIDIVQEDVHLEDLSNKKEVIEYIKTGGKDLETHTIKPLMTVVIREEVESKDNIGYDIEIEESPDMYNTESEIKVKGQLGEEKIITEQIKHNGEVIEKKIIEKKVIKDPINEIVVKGTKEKPKTEATGSFLMPIEGKLSSRYGSRWGRMHQGIDIAKGEGSDIKAADGGLVTSSGAMGTYGNMIEIDHGNSYKTRYAHCSKLLFNVGDRVYKGQVIAKVGSTGRSTGPHLHFEVIKDGVHQNPHKYVN